MEMQSGSTVWEYKMAFWALLGLVSCVYPLALQDLKVAHVIYFDAFSIVCSLINSVSILINFLWPLITFIFTDFFSYIKKASINKLK